MPQTEDSEEQEEQQQYREDERKRHVNFNINRVMST
jgi:hypothetical protein